MNSGRLRGIIFLINILGLLALAAVFCVLRFGKPERAFLAPEYLRVVFVFLSALLLGFCLSAARNRASRSAGVACILLACAFLALMAALGLYCYQIRSMILAPDAHALSQAGLSQAFRYVMRFILNPDGGALFTGVFLVTVFLALLTASRLKPGGSRKVRFLAPVLCALLLGTSVYLFSGGLTAGAWRAGLADARNEMRAMDDFYAALFAGSGDPVTVPDASGERPGTGLHVLILDSSASRNFMGAWGAPFDTTPWLEGFSGKGRLTVLPRAFSSSVTGGEALLYALTAGRPGEYRAGASSSGGVAETIVGAARRSGMDVVWLSNVREASVNFTSAQAGAASLTLRGVKPERSWPEPDEVLLPLLDEALGSLDKNKGCLLVLHLAGSSHPYGARVPVGYAVQVPEGKGRIGELADKTPLLFAYRDYLASLRHTDELLEQIMLRLESLDGQDGRPVTALYLSDKGEEFHKRRAWGEFAWPLAEVPVWVWLSDAYRSLYQDRAANLEKNAGLAFTTDRVFDLLAGLSGIDSAAYAEERDISAAGYAPEPHAPNMPGGRSIDDAPELSIARHLRDGALANLGVHACNTVLKMEFAARHGIRRVELDLVYNGDPSAPALMVGHDPRHMTALDFEEFLRLFSDRLDFIWLDVKNIAPETNLDILGILRRLDAEYGLRGRVLVESKDCGALKVFAEDGWKTSWYLRWKDIERAVAENRVEEFAGELAASLKANSVSGISYALTVEADVRDRLAPHLPAGTKSYCWEPGWTYSDKDLKDKAGPHGRLGCLLVELPTPFELF